MSRRYARLEPSINYPSMWVLYGDSSTFPHGPQFSTSPESLLYGYSGYTQNEQVAHRFGGVGFSGGFIHIRRGPYRSTGHFGSAKHGRHYCSNSRIFHDNGRNIEYV